MTRAGSSGSSHLADLLGNLEFRLFADSLTRSETAALTTSAVLCLISAGSLVLLK